MTGDGMTLPEIRAAGLGPKCANPLCKKPLACRWREPSYGRVDGRWHWHVYRNGWCQSCWTRWRKLGKPEGGPEVAGKPCYREDRIFAAARLGNVARRKQRLDRMEDALYLHDQHLNTAQIAQRMGLTERTIQRYLKGRDSDGQ